jgi:hypothetical protein
MNETIFDEFRKHIGNGAEMSDLEVTLETALYELVCVNGLIVTDLRDVPPSPETTWDIDVTEVIQLLNAAIEKFCRPAATEARKEEGVSK